MRRLVILLVFIITPAFAQEVQRATAQQQQQVLAPEVRAFVLALQQAGASAEALMMNHSRELGVRDARIEMLKSLCGEPCKDK